MKTFTWKNGSFAETTQVDPNNRALLYGDGCFETLIWKNARPNYWRYRMDRLERSFEYLRLTPEFQLSEILDGMHRVMHGTAAYRVRLTFFRAGGGKYLPDSTHVEVLLQVESLDSRETSLPSYGRVQIGQTRLPVDDAGNYKLIGKHWQVRASMECQQVGADDLILLNARDEVSECIRGNLFMITEEGDLVTPPLTSGCLAGVVRSALIHHHRVAERVILLPMLESAAGLFSTNSVSGITVLDWDGKSKEHPLIASLKSRLEEWAFQ